jgi:hypothetical protein
MVNTAKSQETIPTLSLMNLLSDITPYCINIEGERVVPKKIHILRDVIYVLLFEVELSYGSNVYYDIHSKKGVNQMNASTTM